MWCLFYAAQMEVRSLATFVGLSPGHVVTGLIHAPRGGHIYLWELAGKTALCHLVCQAGHGWCGVANPPYFRMVSYYMEWVSVPEVGGMKSMLVNQIAFEFFCFFRFGCPYSQGLKPIPHVHLVKLACGRNQNMVPLQSLCMKASSFTNRISTSFSHWFSSDESDHVLALSLIHSNLPL